MKPTSIKLGFWLCLAIATIVLVVPASAQAENVVPNPGFEIAGCTPKGWGSIICDWGTVGASVLNRDTHNPHTGNASMRVTCIFCDAGHGPGVLAGSICAPIAPGAHPASFWYRLTGPSPAPTRDLVGLWANFHVSSNCGDPDPDQQFLGIYQPPADGAWHEVAGSLFAENAQSVAFWLTAQPACQCGYWRNTVWFDDLVVEGTTGFTPMPSLPSEGER